MKQSNHNTSSVPRDYGAEHYPNVGPDEIRKDNDAGFHSGHNLTQYPAEVDLLSLLVTFWRARGLMAACIAFFALACVVLSVLLPHKWTSSAIITPADPNQWTQLQQSLIAAQTLGVSYSIDRSGAFELFIKKFQSQLLIEDYLKFRPALIRQYSRTSEPGQELTQAVSAVFLLTKSMAVFNGKNEPPPLYRSWRLSFSGPDAQSAQDTLRGYIDFVADRTTAELQQELHNALLLKIDTEKSILELTFSELQNNHLVRIQRLSYALRIAESAGINAPVYTRGQSMNDDPDFSVALGAKGLASKLNIEKSLSDITELNPELMNRKYRLDALERISIPSASFPVFNYQIPPSYPENSEGPSIMLMLILGALLGGLIGGIYILLRNALVSRRLLSQKHIV